MRQLLLTLMILFAVPTFGAVILQMPNGTMADIDGVASPASGNCSCQAVTALAMTEIDAIRIYVDTASSAGVEEIGIYSFDGATQYFEDVDEFDATSTGVQDLTNDAGFQDTAIADGTYWVCFSADASTTGYVLASSQPPTAQALTAYQATVTCTSGNLPATISPSGAWTANGTLTVLFTDLD